MAFAYQDPQYFLTQGNGPWGQQSWSYDRIGNRLSELAASESFTYSYLANPVGGHNPKLSRIEPAPGGEPGSRLDFSYDAAGNQTMAAAVTGEDSGRTSLLDYSAESRLSRLATSNGPSSTELLYDGRGYLRRSRLTATNTSDFEQTEPVYDSEGLLLARRYHKQSTRGGRGDVETPPVSQVVAETAYLFYFAGRPVAQLRRPQAGGGADTLLYLTTDHLGTPIQATDTAGALVWEGGLDPFGTPFVFPRGEVPPEGGDRDTVVAGLSKSASATLESAGIFLRFPGQWDDPSFRSHGLREGLYYNVHRWYGVGISRYDKPDPLGLLPPDRGAENLYIYAFANPLGFTDPLGLDAFTSDPGVQDCMYCLFFKAGYGHQNYEEGMWLVCDQGKFHCDIWPSTRRQGNSQVATTSSNPKPPNACGIFHTHPSSKTPEPSSCTRPECDIPLAKRINLPIYTIHPTGIWKYDPTTDTITQESGPDWFKDPKKRCKKPCTNLP